MPDTLPDWSGEIRGRLAALRLKPEREAEIVEELSRNVCTCCGKVKPGSTWRKATNVRIMRPAKINSVSASAT
jgi:hypothetical protein